MLPRPNAFADELRIRALAETLEATVDQVNIAFAAYLPRDTVEAGMVEEILILRYNLHQATRAARNPSLNPLQADRLRRTVCALMRQQERVSVRLEKRQYQSRGDLPQQYWRDTPIEDVGPYETGEFLPASPPPEHDAMAESPPPLESVPARLTAAGPLAEGDPRHHHAPPRISAGQDAVQPRPIAERDPARSPPPHSHRGIPADRLAA
jgi:hypothetical protein